MNMILKGKAHPCIIVLFSSLFLSFTLTHVEASTQASTEFPERMLAEKCIPFI